MKALYRIIKWHGACYDQRLLFRKTFGNGGEITRERIYKAANVGLNLYWAGSTLLPKKKRELFVARYDAEVRPNHVMRTTRKPEWQADCANLLCDVLGL